MQTKLTFDQKRAFNQGDIATGMNFKLPQLTRPVNILVLGVKVLSSDVANPPAGTKDLGYLATINSLEGLSDSMLLIRFNPGTQQVVVLSLPRDTRTYVDGAGVTKINEANALGGPALAAHSTSDLLGGVGIDRYIRINVQGVEKLIDAVGGVTVYVPEDMKYQDDSQHLYINLKQGEQHLNGAQAVQFLRFRYDAYGDIGRVQRQQMFIRALREQVLKPSILARLPQILSVVQSNLDTNLSVEELIALSGFASKISRSNLQMLMLPGSFSGAEYEASYWLPNPDQIKTLMQRYFGLAMASFTKPPEASHVSIAIQNSTQANQTVEKLIEKLGGAGYGDIYVDQPWTEPLATTQIIAQQGNDDEAEAIRQALGFGEVTVESTGNLESDITIRLGEDALAASSPDAAHPQADQKPLPPEAQPDAQPEFQEEVQSAPAGESSSEVSNQSLGESQSAAQRPDSAHAPDSTPNSASNSTPSSTPSSTPNNGQAEVQGQIPQATQSAVIPVRPSVSSTSPPQAEQPSVPFGSGPTGSESPSSPQPQTNRVPADSALSQAPTARPPSDSN
jgi:polyisoprenyl-teichoic acid--peptidoglycan teichoic acid transferase